MTRRRQMMLKKSSGGLPEGYTAVDYLQASGAQWIDTGYRYGASSDVEIKFDAPDKDDGTDLGAQDSNAAKYKFVIILAGELLWLGRGSDGNNIHVDGMQKPITLRNIGKLFKVTDSAGEERTKAMEDAGYVGPERTIYLFARHNTTGATNMSKSQIYYCRFYENGELICDMRPCLDADGVPCMYDLIRQQTLYNQGTGSFTWG